MPAITRLRTSQRISTSVTSARAVDGGKSATYMALAQAGAEGEKIANRVLTTRRNHETSLYTQRSMEDKDLASLEALDTLSNRMDPSTGRIIDEESQYNGMLIDEAMEQVEAVGSKRILEEAPTEHARRATALADGPATHRRLLSVDLYKNKQIQIAVQETFEQRTDARMKAIQVHNPNTSGMSYIDVTTKKLIDMKAGLAMDLVSDVNTKRKNDRIAGGKIAETGANQAVHEGDWDSVARFIQLPAQLKTKAQRTDMVNALNADGNFILEIKKVGNDYALVHVEKDAQGKNLVTYMNMGVLDISGEVKEDNLAHKYITPETNQSLLRQYMSHMKGNKRAELAELKRSQAGIQAAMRDRSLTNTQQNEILKRSNDKALKLLPEKEATSFITSNSAVKLSNDAVGRMALLPPSERAKITKAVGTISQKHLEIAGSEDVGKLEVNAALKEKAVNLTRAGEKELLRTQHTIGHLTKYSNYFRGIFNKRMNSPKHYAKFMAQREVMQGRMNVSQLVGDNFTPAELGTAKKQLEPLLDTSSAKGIDNLIKWVNFHKDTRQGDFRSFVESIKTDKLEDATGMVLSMDTSTPYGHASVTEILQNANNREGIEKNFQVAMEVLDASSEKVPVLGGFYSPGRAFKINLKGAVVESLNESGMATAILSVYGASGQTKLQSVYDHITLAAKKRYFGETKNAKTLGKEAYERLFKDNFVVVGNINGAAIIPKTEKSTMTKEVVEKIINSQADTKNWDTSGLKDNRSVQKINKKENNTGKAADARAKELFDGNSLGTPKVVIKDDRVYYMLRDSRGRSTIIPGANDKDISKPLQQAKEESDSYVEPSAIDSIKNYLMDWVK